ncbi:MAG: FAD-dependent oxidoreductase, partial [Clostridia bacterium]|nr:FAD-dependent oxidoreductase [Clostridia bacterium]
MQRIANVTLAAGEDEKRLKTKVLRLAKMREENLRYYKIIRKSLDARDKRDIKWVYTVDVSDSVESVKTEFLRADKKANVLVVGAGPAGLFAALYLLRGGLNVTLIERGKSVDERKKDVSAFFSGGAL